MADSDYPTSFYMEGQYPLDLQALLVSALPAERFVALRHEISIFLANGVINRPVFKNRNKRPKLTVILKGIFNSLNIPFDDFTGHVLIPMNRTQVTGGIEIKPK
jgi:hypothetical protein